MPLLLLKDVPRYECLLAAAELYPTMNPIAHEAFLHLLRTADLAGEEQRRFFTKIGMTQGRFSVLMLLFHSFPDEEPATPAALAEMAGVTRATMTGLLDTLERDGLIAREADEHDRRLIRVRLTPSARELEKWLFPDWCSLVESMMTALDDGECRQLAALLQKLQTKLSAPPSSN